MDNIIYQSGKLYVKVDGKYRHVTTPEVFNKMELNWDWKKRKFIPDEEIQANRGKDITEWPEKQEEVTIRKMAILGTCLPKCEQMWKNLEGTHFYGNRYDWPNYNLAEELGMKVFVNPHGHYNLSENSIRQMVLDWKDRPGCGGFWSDEAGGHEPDITNRPVSDIQHFIDERKRFYYFVRQLDPDVQNHPVMEMMDMTSFYDFSSGKYPGWEKAFSDETHDLLLFDCYPPAEWTNEKMIEGMERAWKKFISVFPHTHQVIPQINACSYRKGTIWLQYNFWNEKMSSDKFDNPFRGPISLCYYKDEYVRKSEEMQNEITEVNKKIMGG